jgi:hypothetical protein
MAPLKDLYKIINMRKCFKKTVFSIPSPFSGFSSFVFKFSKTNLGVKQNICLKQFKTVTVLYESVRESLIGWHVKSQNNIYT